MPLKLPRIKKIWIIIAGALLIGFISMNYTNSKIKETMPSNLLENTPANMLEKHSLQWTMKDYEEHYEASMKLILEEIEGVGEVLIKVNLDSTEEKVYQTNTRRGTQVTNEKDYQGGNRTVNDATEDQTVVTINNGAMEVPVEIKTVKPTIRGVVIVAEGAQTPNVKAWIFDVVQRSLDVPPHRISVVPKRVN